MATIQHLEELSMNAWPALQTLFYDGWVLRFANGYTKRANSIHPLYPSIDDPCEKIAACEQLYQNMNQSTVFKMTSVVQPNGLDALLEERGYRLDSPTSVQTLDLAIKGPTTHQSTVSETLSETWLADCCRLSGIEKRYHTTLRKMLCEPHAQTGFFSIQQHGQTIVCGMGAVQNQYVGLFDIVTDKNYRNQGYGHQLVSDLLAWGKERGAQTAYLQVMLNNSPALRLYSKLGFKESYRYWYRIAG
jgi:ribosomal protein S18 acetylase RimI-like enzyme